MKKLLIAAAVIIAIAIVIIFAMRPRYAVAPIASPSPFTSADVRISKPLPNQEMLAGGKAIIVGEAKGTWFFEGTFPIRLEDSKGKVLATDQARAQGNWMTTDFVPFRADVNIPALSSPTSGFIILAKDNPSGLPQNDASIKLPIQLVLGVL